MNTVTATTVDSAMAQLVAELLPRLRTSQARPVVLIDGGSGSGKTTVALALAELLRPHLAQRGPVTVASLDDAYPGWDGLAAGTLMVPGMITAPECGHATWDWVAGRFAGWRPLPEDGLLLVEGCGSITAHNRTLATVALWCEQDREVRRAQAIERDGASFARQWDRWEAQEHEHWRRHRPWAVAELTLDLRAGVTRLGHT